ncbi:MAG: sensor histidine kinase [Eggerthellaceae bacterium]|nr:sensor histidine kinase [Eggerthellaceae bacterium]
MALTDIDILFALPCQLVLVYMATRLLDIRHKGWFWLVSLVLILPFVLQLVQGQPTRMILGTVAMVVPCLVFARDPLPRRIFVVLLIQLVIVISEIPSSFLWGSVVGPDAAALPQAEDAPFYFVIAHLLHLVVLTGLLVVIEALERWLTSTRTNSGTAQFFGFIFVQYLLIGFSVGIMQATGNLSPPVITGNLLAALVCVGADAFFFPFMERYNLKVREDQRSQVLAAELSHYLDRYQEVEHEVSAVARVRHDLRNQVNVVLMLIDEGEVDEARGYVRQLISLVLAVTMDEARGAGGDAPHALGDDAADEGGVPDGAPADGEARAARPGARFLRTPRRRAAASLVFPLSQLAVLSFLVWYIASYPLPSWVIVAVAVAALLCAVADALLFRALAAIDEEGLAAERVRLLEEQRALQQVYFERLRSGLAEARAMRRDIVAMLYEVERLLTRHRSQEAADLIGQAVDLMDASDERCCENRAVGALMAMKLRTCLEEGIDVDCQIVVPDGLAILDVDLCAVFSNLMDNAIRSCRQVRAPFRRITVKACVVSGVLLVDVVNGRVEDGAAPAPSERGGDAGDERDDGLHGALTGRALPVPSHGWGLQILRSLADRYGGSFRAEPEGPWFHSTIMLINERPAQTSLGGGRSAKAS